MLALGKNIETTGISLLLELYECKAPALHSAEALEQLFLAGLTNAGFETVDHILHRFPGQGVTLVYILRQSHATLHTWPEKEYASVDVFSCGKLAAVRPAPESICRYLSQRWLPVLPTPNLSSEVT